jgi:hypothetical protein
LLSGYFPAIYAHVLRIPNGMLQGVLNSRTASRKRACFAA